MLLFGLTVIASGAYLAYRGYKRKFIKVKEGQTLQDMATGMLKSDPDAAIRQSMNVGCSMYLKIVSIVVGIALFFFGLIIALL